MTAREAFCLLLRNQYGRLVLMGGRAPELFDCSELVAWALAACGGPDMRSTHRAQHMHDETPNLATFSQPPMPQPGDLCFYGQDAASVSHVAVWLSERQCISADGATSKVTSEEVARKLPGARVRIHVSWKFRGDLPYAVMHRNTWLDALETK